MKEWLAQIIFSIIDRVNTKVSYQSRYLDFKNKTTASKATFLRFFSSTSLLTLNIAPSILLTMFWKGPNLFSSVMSKNDVSVYDEAMEMLAAALIIYIFADLRDLARATEASVKIEDLEPPMATDKMLENIKINKEALMASCEYNDLEERLVTLEHLRVNMIGPVGNMFAQNMSSQLVKFVDTNGERIW